MQDWLAQHKLDRKHLAVLAGNASAAQAYEDYLHATIEEVVEDLLAPFFEPPAPQGTALPCCMCLLRSVNPKLRVSI